MKSIVCLIILFAGLSSINGQSTNEIQEEEKVIVYYFHNERRCATCMNVEKVSKQFVAELYSGKVQYKVFNLDGERGKAASEKLGINVQSLLIVKADNIIDITSSAFLYAKNKPEKLKNLIKEKIDPLL